MFLKLGKQPNDIKSAIIIKFKGRAQNSKGSKGQVDPGFGSSS